MKRSVVIGAAEQHRVPAKVTESTIRMYSSIEDLVFVHTYYRDLQLPPGPTGFSLIRFGSPDFADRKGRVLYFDSDMLIYGDVAELFNMDMQGFHVIAPVNQSAVMLMDAETCPFTLEEAKKVYGSARGIMQFSPALGDAQVARRLPLAWNCLDRKVEGTKNLHYTNMRTQPWIPERLGRHRHADLWFEALVEALDRGIVKPGWVREDVAEGYLHEECLRVLQ